MIRKSLLFALLTVALGPVLLTTVPAQAITGPGEIDTVHTNVGVIRFTLPEERFRCSGTLIAPKVVLTAGHCTEGPATNVLVSFDDKLIPDPLAAGISDAERRARMSHYITGTTHPDPA